MTKKSILVLSAALVACSLSLRAQNADEIYSKVDEKPVALKMVPPVAPVGETGLVAVLCVIDESGRVIQASVSKSTNQALDKAAVAAIQKWSFQPAKKDGKAVKVRVAVPVRFDDQA